MGVFLRSLLVYLLAWQVLLCGSFAYSEELKLSQPIPLNPSVLHGKLPNGLTYYVLENKEPQEQLYLSLVVNAGSVLEDDSQRGLAHFVEHMAFNGTKSFAKNELISYLQEIGMQFGNDLNAYTSFDETVYQLTIPVRNKTNIEKGFQVLREWGEDVSFKKEDIVSETSVVLEELRLGKGAEDRVIRQFFPKLFANSQYGVRRPIGTEESLQSFQHDDLRRFYRDWYRPELMAVIVVGDLPKSEGEALVKKYFSNFTAKWADRPKRVEHKVPKRQQVEGMVVTDPELAHTTIKVIYNVEPYHEERLVGEFRDRIIQGLFDYMMSYRLFELSRAPGAPFLNASSSITNFVRGHRGYVGAAVIGSSGVTEAVQALIRESRRVRKFGFLESELKRAKEDLFKSVSSSYAERDNTNSNVLSDELTRHFLVAEPSPGIELEYLYYREFLPRITLADLTKFARRVIPKKANYFVLLTAPETEKGNLLSVEQLLQVISESEAEEVQPYEENKIADFDVTPQEQGQVVEKNFDRALDITTLKLSNDTTFLLKPTQFKDDEVLLVGFRPGGSSAYGEGDHFNLKYLTDIVDELGAGDYSKVKLLKALNGKKIGLSFDLDTYQEELMLGASATDMEAALQLLHLSLVRPRADQEAFDSYIKRNQSAWKNNLENPNNVFFDDFSRFYFNSHPRRPTIARPEDLAKVNLSRVLELFKERYSNLAGYTFVVVGKFEIEKMTGLIEKYLGYGKDRTVPSGLRDIGLIPTRGYRTQKFYSGQDDKATALLTFSGKEKYSAWSRLKLLGLQEVIQLRALEKLREELGGVYTVQVSANLTNLPVDNFVFKIAIPGGEKRIDEVKDRMLQEIANIKKFGPSEQELKKVKANWENEYEKGIKNNVFWLGTLTSYLLRSESLHDILNFKDKIAKITITDIKEVANRFLATEYLVEVVHLPKREL